MIAWLIAAVLAVVAFFLLHGNLGAGIMFMVAGIICVASAFIWFLYLIVDEMF